MIRREEWGRESRHNDTPDNNDRNPASKQTPSCNGTFFKNHPLNQANVCRQSQHTTESIKGKAEIAKIPDIDRNDIF